MQREATHTITGSASTLERQNTYQHTGMGSTQLPAALPDEIVDARDFESRIQRSLTEGAPFIGPDGLPDLTLPCLGAGPAVRLAGLRGTPYVVNLWASWCKPCRAELPLFAALDAATSEVALLGVDVEDDPASAVSLLVASGVHYPSVRDDARATRLPLRWTGLPMTLFVAADGVVQHVERAPITTQAQLDGLVQQYLGVQVAS